MKKNLLLIYFACIVSATYAQNPVPNPSFESWTSGEPDSWLTNNIPGTAVFVTQVSPGNTGSSAARGDVMTITPPGLVLSPYLSSTDNSANGFPVNKPYGTMSCYYKFNPASGDMFQITVLMEDGAGNAVGAGSIIITNATSNFTLTNVPIFYIDTSNVSKCTIMFSIADSAGNAHMNSYYIVDDVSLSGSVGINELSNSSIQNMSVMPNPASSQISVSYSLLQSNDAELSIIDMTGRKVQTMKLNNMAPGKHSTLLDVSSLKDGLYLCRLTTADASMVRFLQVRH